MKSTKYFFIRLVVFTVLVLFLILLLNNLFHKTRQYYQVKNNYNFDKQILHQYLSSGQKEEQIKEGLNKISKSSIPQKDNAFLFDFIMKYAQKADIRILTFTPIENRKELLKVKLVVRGNYIDLIQFFKGLECSAYYLAIGPFEIYQVNTQQQITEADLSIVFY